MPDLKKMKVGDTYEVEGITYVITRNDFSDRGHRVIESEEVDE
jgi:hypothetical protein